MLAMLKSGVGRSETPFEAAARKLVVGKAVAESIAVASVGPLARRLSQKASSQTLSVVYKWLERETRVWSSCSHDNILNFIGYYAEEDSTLLYLFSPYMRNGNARTYLNSGQPTMEERFLLVGSLHLQTSFSANACFWRLLLKI